MTSNSSLLILSLLTACLSSLTVACSDDSGSSSAPSSNATETSNTSMGTDTTQTSMSSDCSVSPNTTSEGSPERILIGESVEANICPGETHWFALNLDQGSKAAVRLEFEEGSGELEFVEYPDRGVDDPITLAFDWPQSLVRVARYTATQNGDLVLAFKGPADQAAPISYKVHANNICKLDSDCTDGLVCDRRTLSCGNLSQPGCGFDDDQDPNDSTGVAFPFDVGTDLTGMKTCGFDSDWYTIDIANDGDSFTASMTYEFTNSTHFAAVFVLDDEGNVIGEKYRNPPMRANTSLSAQAPHVVAGRYYAVVLSSSVEGAPVDEFSYTFEINSSTGPCTDSFECTAPRPICSSGLCVGIEGNGQVPVGGQCDDIDDCEPKANQCLTISANVNAWFCTVTCTDDEACSSLGNNAFCYWDHLSNGCQSEGVCYPRVQEDLACPPSTFLQTVGEDAGKCLQCGDFPCGIGECIDGACWPEECLE